MYVEKLDIGEFMLPDFAAWKQNGIRSQKLNALIAPEDLWILFDGDKWRYFNPVALEMFEEQVLKPNGWRLPTDDEWLTILNEFGTRDGETKLGLLVEKLNLAYGGYVREEDFDDYCNFPHDPAYIHNYARSGCYASIDVSAHSVRRSSSDVALNRYFYYLKERDPIYGCEYVGVCGTTAHEAYRVRCISVK